MNKFVTTKKLMDLYGFSRDNIARKRKNNIWIEGVHFCRRERRLFFNVSAIDKWIEEGNENAECKIGHGPQIV